MPDDLRQKLVPAVQNATAILRHLSAMGAPVGATQVARDCGLNVSSAFNILRTLHQEGLLTFDPQAKTYRLGIGLLDLAAPLLTASPADMIRPLIARIAETQQVMIGLWHITATGRIILTDSVAAERIVQAVIAPGSRLPAFAGAMGRCYVAALGLDETAARKGYDAVRWQAAPGFAAYWADVATTRSAGFAADHGNLFRGLEIVAAVVRDRTGTPRIGMSSITIAGQHTPADLTTVGHALAAAAGRIESGLFGHRNLTITSGKDHT